MIVLKSLAGNDAVKHSIVEAGGIEYIVEGMTRHARHTGIAEGGCAALTMFALRVPENCVRIISAGGADAIIKAMQLHQTSSSLQVRELVSCSLTVKFIYVNIFLFSNGEIYI